MKHLLAFFLALCAFGAQAADLYYCKCDTGAHGSCVAGSDGNAGTSGSPKLNVPSEATISAAAAGDRFLFGKGCAWTGLSAIRVSNLNSTAASRITFTSYSTSFDSSTKPILTFADGEHGFRIGVFGPPDFNSNTSDDKGYIITGLDIRGGTGTNRAFEIVGLVSDILIDDVRMSGFHKGGIVHKAGDNKVRRLVVRNSLIENNRTDGWLGVADEDMVFEGNTLSGNNNTSGNSGGCGAGFCHAAYLGADTGALRITVRNNTFTNNSVGSEAGTCSGGNLTMRGQIDQALVEGNVITETTYSSGCGGISMNEGYFSTEYIRRLILRGNTVVGSYGSLGAISMNIGPGAIIENNRIIDNISGVTTGSGMNIGIHSAPEGDDFADNVVVKNNTVYLLYANNAAGISISSRSGHSVFNNLIYTGASSTSRCFAHGVLANYAVWDYNHCHRAGSGNWSSTYTTLANAQAAGFDTNGTEGDPLFNNTPSSGNSWDLSVQAGSPVVGTGRNTGKPVRDVLWCNRGNPPDKGAHERGGTPCLTVRSPNLVR